MHSIWKFFLNKRAFTYLLMVTLSLGGIYSLIAIPKESAPEVIVPVGIVSTGLRGASAEDIEQLITKKLEDEIANTSGIDKVTSSSREGLSVITAQFNASSDVTTSIQSLKDAVDKAKGDLPSDATTPLVTKINFADQPFLIVSVSMDISPLQMTTLGETLKNTLQEVSGVAKVEISGTRKKEIQVVVRKDALTKYELSYNQVISALGGANASLPIGTLVVSDIEYPIKFDGKINSGSQIPDITIATKSGVPIYLRDIAFIADGLEQPKSYSRISAQGAPSENAITLSIYKKSGGDVTSISKKVKAKIEALKEKELLGAHVVITFDGGAQVKKDLRELTKVGFETVVLVMLMLFLTIGWRESIVAGLSIPLSFVIAFIGLLISGNTINFISLFSLILAIGILVDSGIVVTEAIHTRTKLLGNSYKAALLSLEEYAWPLIAGTMTTVAVFSPLFFLSGVVGQFISSIPFTIIFVLLASIVVALGMVPLLAIILTKKDSAPSSFERLQEEWSARITSWYTTFLNAMLLNKKRQKHFLFALGFGFFIALSLPILGIVRVQFFPQDDQGLLFISIEKPQGTPLSVTDLSVREVEEILYNAPYVDSFVTTVGASSAFTGNGSASSGKLANITVILQDKKNRSQTSSLILETLRKELAPITSATVRVDQGNNGPPSTAPVVIEFLGNNLDDLSLAVDKGEALLTEIPGTRDVTTSLKDDGLQFEITIDKAKATNVGLSSLAVAQVLRTAISGVTATTITTTGQDVDIVVKTDLNPTFINPEDTNKATIESIKELPVITPSGNSVLLGSLIDIHVAPSKTVIEHKNKVRIATVSSKLLQGANAISIVNAFKEKEKTLALGEGVTIHYGGENEDVNKTFSEMALALLAGMALMLAILVIEFNSFRYSFYLLFTIPLSLIGVLGGLALSLQTLSFSSMLGLIALAGVIINHAIILLDSILHRLEEEQRKKERQEDYKKLHDVVVTASAIRLRPIFLTTITTVVGMIPLTTVSALWGPLAFAIMFGLSFAMVLTLLLIPVLFYRYPGKCFASLKD